jgi:hypothetical protein
MRFIRAGALNAYLPVRWPGRLLQVGRGRAALVAERDHVACPAWPCRRRATRTSSPRRWGSAENVPARYRRSGGLAVRIAVLLWLTMPGRAGTGVGFGHRS